MLKAGSILFDTNESGNFLEHSQCSTISKSLHKVVSICPSLGFSFSEIKWDNCAATNDAKSSKRGVVCDFIG